MSRTSKAAFLAMDSIIILFAMLILDTSPLGGTALIMIAGRLFAQDMIR
jgi:hypothetical protein